MLLAILLGLFSFSPQAQAQGGKQLVVGYWETHFDKSHPAIRGKEWTNLKEIPGDQIDNDGNGYVDDIHGWNFADNNNVLYEVNTNFYTPDHARYIGLVWRRKIGQATPEELTWFDQVTGEMMKLYGGFIGWLHGTYAADVALRNTKFTKYVGLRNTTADELRMVATPSTPVAGPLPAANPNEMKQFAYDQAVLRLMTYKKAFAYAEAAGVRAIHMGVIYIHHEAYGPFLRGMLNEKLGKDCTDAEAQEMGKYYFSTLVTEGKTQVFSQFPHILFLFAAGNGGINNDNEMTFPQGIKLPNTMVVGGSNLQEEKHNFSSYGPKTVETLIPTNYVWGAIPENGYVMSGTTSVSVAVAMNLATLILEENLLLKPDQVRKIMLETAEMKPALKDIVMNSGVIHPARAIQAAHESQFMSIDDAIKKSFVLVK